MKLIAFFVFNLIGAYGYSQVQEKEQSIDLEQFAERMFQVQDSDVDYEDVYESLLLFYTDPLNLNKATEEQLGALYILSPLQIESFLKHREEQGDLLSIYELQAVEYFDLSLIQDLLPFVTVRESRVDNRPLLSRILAEPNNYLLLRYSLRSQDQDRDDFIGNPYKLYGRFRVSHRDDFSAGLTFENDAGERNILGDGQVGFDFYSAHFMLENQGRFDKIIAGDFQLQVGQGLVFGAGFNPGKGAETVNTVKRNTIGIRPYTSVLETGFFRGMGGTIPIGKVEVTAFYSYLLQDGNLPDESITDDFEQYISSIQSSGLHSTEKQLEDKNTVEERSMGAVLNFKPNRKFQIGMTALATKYSVPLKRTDVPYNLFEFNGDENVVASLFGSYQWQNFNFFGESARSSSGGLGSVGGFIASLDRTVDLAFSVRDYQRDFHSFYGQGFGEGSRNINEKGIYWGLKYRPSRTFELAGYYDRFSFPWLRFGINAPSDGSEWLGRFTYRPSRDITAYIQVREESKGTSTTVENLSLLGTQTKRNYIFNIDYRLNPNFSMKTRLQTSTFDEFDQFSSGYAIMQDLNYEIEKFKFSGRMALFETDNYDNRQYVYEKDVLYAFSIPAYNGQGVRQYLMVQYSATRKLAFWARLASFTNRNRFDLDEGEDAVRREIKFMIRKRF